jgi:hypothetical protein
MAEVRHNIAGKRFELEIDGHMAVLEYELGDGAITFTHTGVPAALEGQGIGASLVKAGLGHARAVGLKVVSVCWFVAGYIERHPEYQDLLNTA